jgi:hypothetical protein
MCEGYTCEYVIPSMIDVSDVTLTLAEDLLVTISVSEKDEECGTALSHQQLEALHRCTGAILEEIKRRP